MSAMASLPEAISITPLPGPVFRPVVVPGSKSITNRALILAALAEGETHLTGALWSEDTRIMTEALNRLGFEIQVDPDPLEPSNRTIRIAGRGGALPPQRTGEPLDLFVGNAGTAARFLAALVCLGRGAYRLHGVPRMHQRPQAALFRALRELGYRIEAAEDRLPAIIHGAGPRRGQCAADIQESSQFASALLLCARAGGWVVEVTGENAEESPYVRMTRQLIAAFPGENGVFPIEPDASSGSYFWAAAYLLGSPLIPPAVADWPQSDWQVDARFPAFLPLRASISRQTDLGDSILTAMILAPFAREPIRFTDLGRLRLQECERVAAMRAELTKCGARVEEEADSLRIYPADGALHGAEIETYDDHRMAMCFAVLGLKVPGMVIRDPGCVRKTFPNFFQKLAAAPPLGLGASIREADGGRRLRPEELLAG